MTRLWYGKLNEGYFELIYYFESKNLGLFHMKSKKMKFLEGQ